jgi:hypothetical protein
MDMPCCYHVDSHILVLFSCRPRAESRRVLMDITISVEGASPEEIERGIVAAMARCFTAHASRPKPQPKPKPGSQLRAGTSRDSLAMSAAMASPFAASGTKLMSQHCKRAAPGGAIGRSPRQPTLNWSIRTAGGGRTRDSNVSKKETFACSATRTSSGLLAAMSKNGNSRND